MEPYNILLRKIKQGEFPVGSRITPERQLADELQVSRTSVRRAILRLAEEGWLEARPGFRPVVRTLPTGSVQNRNGAQNKTVALLMGSQSAYQPFSQILRGCEVELRRQGYLLVFLDTWAETTHNEAERGDREKETLAYLSGQAINGVILWCQNPETSTPLLRRLRNNETGVVTIDREIPGDEFDHVGVDNFRAAQRVVDYLIEAHHRDIAFATEDVDHASTVTQRIDGFLFGMQSHGLTTSERSLIRFPFRASADQMVTQLRRLKETGEMPSAIFAVNDLYAWRLIRALQSLNLRVPEEVSVVGFDDMEPPLHEEGFLTTVRQPFSDIGRLAVRTLLQRLEEPELPVRQILLPTALIERSSVRRLGTTAPPRSADTTVSPPELARQGSR